MHISWEHLKLIDMNKEMERLLAMAWENLRSSHTRSILSSKKQGCVINQAEYSGQNVAKWAECR